MSDATTNVRAESSAALESRPTLDQILSDTFGEEAEGEDIGSGAAVGSEAQPADGSSTPAADAASALPDPDASAPAAPTSEEPSSTPAANSAAPSETPPAKTEAKPPFAFTVDGTKVDVPGAFEDGDNIVVPKASWNQTVKNYLGDRQAHRRQLADRDRRERDLSGQVEQERGVAQTLFAELQKIGQLPEAESFAKWEEFHRNFPAKVLAAERDFYKNRHTQGTQQQEQQRTEERLGRFQNDVYPRWVEENALPEILQAPAFQDVVGEPTFKQWVSKLLLEDRDTLVRFTGDVIPELDAPAFDLDHPRFLRVVERAAEIARSEVTRKKQLAEIDAAARTNADKNRPKTPAPPAAPAGGAPGGAKKKSEVKDWHDFERKFLAGELDD